ENHPDPIAEESENPKQDGSPRSSESLERGKTAGGDEGEIPEQFRHGPPAGSQRNADARDDAAAELRFGRPGPRIRRLSGRAIRRIPDAMAREESGAGVVLPGLHERVFRVLPHDRGRGARRLRSELDGEPERSRHGRTHAGYRLSLALRTARDVEQDS